MSTFAAFIDANVFYGARLRSLILYLAQTKMFRARWSAEVHDEWIRNLLVDRPDLSAAVLERTREAMDKAVPDCLVTGYHALIDGLALPDQADRHILAAAIRCKASCIVTANSKHFPAAVLEGFDIHAVHPDDFLLDLFGIDAEAFIEAVKLDFQHYKAPPLVFGAYADALAKAGVPKTAERIRQLSVVIVE
jgi:hypothetical protein